MQRYSDDVKSAALTMYADGFSITETNEALGITVTAYLARQAKIVRSKSEAFEFVRLRKRGRFLPDEILSAAMSMYADGFGSREVEEALGVSPTTVIGLAKDAGINRNAMQAKHLDIIKRKGKRGYTDQRGYYRMTYGGRKMLAHRVVMEQMLGRPLGPDEKVHHKNGNKSDNRPENLELWVHRQPSGQRVKDRVRDAVSLLKRYAPDKLRPDKGGRIDGPRAS